MTEQYGDGAGAQLVYCSCPDRGVAQQIADRLVSGGLAACVTLVPGVHSTYRWQGALQRDEEVLLMIKSHSSRYQALEQAIGAIHPYELPEIIAVSIEQGLAGYLNWIEQCTRSES